jgi:hypothetical protein
LRRGGVGGGGGSVERFEFSLGGVFGGGGRNLLGVLELTHWHAVEEFLVRAHTHTHAHTHARTHARTHAHTHTQHSKLTSNTYTHTAHSGVCSVP